MLVNILLNITLAIETFGLINSNTSRISLRTLGAGLLKFHKNLRKLSFVFQRLANHRFNAFALLFRSSRTSAISALDVI